MSHCSLLPTPHSHILIIISRSQQWLNFHGIFVVIFKVIPEECHPIALLWLEHFTLVEIHNVPPQSAIKWRLAAFCDKVPVSIKSIN
jgi:hypothetical protein